MATPIRISLTKKAGGAKPDLNPVVPLAKIELEPKEHSKANGQRATKPETFECPFCVRTFSAENFLEEHLTDFHRISRKKIDEPSPKIMGTEKVRRNNRVSRSPKKTVSNGKSEKVRGSNEEAEASMGDVHQCFVCALEFKLASTLKLHLQMVHQIGDAQNLVERSKPNPEAPVQGNGELKLF